MDRILGSTFEVTLGGKEYTLSPIKIKTLSKAMAFFKRRKVTDFIAIAKETELPADIFAGELHAIRVEHDMVGFEEFMEDHEDDIDFGLYCLYLGLKDFEPDLSFNDFENFPQKDIESAMEALEALVPKIDKKKAGKMKEATLKRVAKRKARRKAKATV